MRSTQPSTCHCDLVDQIDGVGALGAVLLGGMHGVDPDVARTAAGVGLAALADGGGRGAGLVEAQAVLAVQAAVPQVVQVGDGQARQASELAPPVELELAP